MHHFLLHGVICSGGYFFVHTPIFLKNTWAFLGFLGFPKNNFCVFPSVPHMWTIMPKLWMSGVGTLCAIAHYRAALFIYYYLFGKKYIW